MLTPVRKPPGGKLLDEHKEFNKNINSIRYQIETKVFGCLRTITGAEQFCAIRSHLATSGKHDIGFFHALTSLIEGHAWMPEDPLTS